MQPPTCNQAESKRRNRREDGNKSQDDGSEAMIEVYSGLYVNEATDIHKPEQMDQVMEKVHFHLFHLFLIFVSVLFLKKIGFLYFIFVGFR